MIHQLLTREQHIADLLERLETAVIVGPLA
jgi:hypothetical protein